MKKTNIFRLLGIGTFATGLAMLDNSIKNSIEDGEIDNGLMLNKFSNKTKEVTALSVFVMFFQALITLNDALEKDDAVTDMANAFILGGALSNTYDRVERGYVVDYLKVGRKRAIYNLSDFFIIFGVILRLIKAIKDNG